MPGDKLPSDLLPDEGQRGLDVGPALPHSPSRVSVETLPFALATLAPKDEMP